VAFVPPFVIALTLRLLSPVLVNTTGIVTVVFTSVAEKVREVGES